VDSSPELSEAPPDMLVVEQPPAAVVASTDIGRKRQDNEDSFLIFDLGARTLHPEQVQVDCQLDPPGLLLAVADGMGGHQSGQVASQICIETLTAEFLRCLSLSETDQEVEWEQELTNAVETANQQVSTLARDNPEHQGMGTTLTAALITVTKVVVAHVGDSRAYLLRDGELRQLTRDQTVGNSLQQMHQDFKADSRFADMLVQAVGTAERLDVELTTTPLEGGDCLLICCDGLYKVVEASAIAEVVGSAGPLGDRVRELIVRANSAGGPDNITVVLAELRKKAV